MSSTDLPSPYTPETNDEAPKLPDVIKKTMTTLSISEKRR